MADSDATDDTRAEAVKRIKRKRMFQQQLIIHVQREMGKGTDRA